MTAPPATTGRFRFADAWFGGLIAIYLIYALKYGELSGDNPWDSRGYEWMTTSPPPKHNFDVTPTITQDSHSYQNDGEEVEHVVI